MVTVLGLQFGRLIGGAVITEYVFALPGVGRLVVDAVFARDYPLVQGVVLLIAVGFIAEQLVVDMLYGWLDPRIRASLSRAARPSPARRRGRRCAPPLAAVRRAARARLALVRRPRSLLVAVGRGGCRAAGRRPHDPLKQDLATRSRGPSRAHLLGTDNVGRDVLARVIWGTRVSLMAGLGVGRHRAAGRRPARPGGRLPGGRVDGLVMRLMDAVLSFPALVLALALGAVLGAGLTGVLIALGVVYTPTFARLMRGQVLTIARANTCDAARVLGAHRLVDRCAPRAAERGDADRRAGLARAWRSRSWPRRRCRSWASASSRPEPSWGSMINAGRGYLQQAPWIVFGPGRGAVRHRARPELRRRRRARRARPARVGTPQRRLNNS